MEPLDHYLIMFVALMHADTTVAELVKNVVDKGYFLEQIYAEQRKSAMSQ